MLAEGDDGEFVLDLDEVATGGNSSEDAFDAEVDYEF